MYSWFYVLLYSVIYVAPQIFTVCFIRVFYNHSSSMYRQCFYTDISEHQLIHLPEGVLPPCQVCMIEVHRQVAIHTYTV